MNVHTAMSSLWNYHHRHRRQRIDSSTKSTWSGTSTMLSKVRRRRTWQLIAFISQIIYSYFKWRHAGRSRPAVDQECRNSPHMHTRLAPWAAEVTVRERESTQVDQPTPRHGERQRGRNRMAPRALTSRNWFAISHAKSFLVRSARFLWICLFLCVCVQKSSKNSARKGANSWALSSRACAPNTPKCAPRKRHLPSWRAELTRNVKFWNECARRRSPTVAR